MPLNLRGEGTHPEIGIVVDHKGRATDAKTGAPLGRSEVDARIAQFQQKNPGTEVYGLEKKRGGVAGVFDRNKKEINLAATVLPALVATVATGGAASPALLAALGAGTGAAIKGFDREGQGGIGFDAKQGLQGAMQGAGNAALGGLGGGAINAGMSAAGGGMSGVLPGVKAAGKALVAPAVKAVTGGSTTDAQGNPANGGGLFGDIAKWITGNGGMNALGAAQGLNAALLQKKSLDLADQAKDVSMGNWNANNPLREAGRAGMLNPKSSVDTSALPGIRTAGNPFARMGK